MKGEEGSAVDYEKKEKVEPGSQAYDAVSSHRRGYYRNPGTCYRIEKRVEKMLVQLVHLEGVSEIINDRELSGELIEFLVEILFGALECHREGRPDRKQPDEYQYADNEV